MSFALAPGSFCGLIGVNGSGKTTLIRALLGLLPADAGGIEGAARGHRALGYVPQKIDADPYMPLRARDVVALGFDGHRYGLPLPSRRRRDRVAAMLAAVGADAFADRRLGDLSGGQQQRIFIAHALVREPQLLLLDEPLANLDMPSIAGIVSVLKRIARESGVTVLISSHDVNPLVGALDRVIYLAGGGAVSGRPDEVLRSGVLSRLYGHHIDVLRVHGRLVIVPAGETHPIAPDEPHVERLE
ncbi:ATP-binding cassette domain-containing protein [Jiella flava]|uniref:ATP-binding cassette domain-containing protein n=1 Tax=Jiella flava TaxID=2816857 RepID=UPI001A91E4DC